MKILFLNRFFYPDPSTTSRLLSDLAFWLAGRGEVVHVLTSRQSYEKGKPVFPRQATLKGVQIHRVWTTHFGRSHEAGRFLDSFTYCLSVVFSLFFLLNRGDRVVVKNDPPFVSAVCTWLCRIKKAKPINWVQDIYPEIIFKTSSGKTNALLFQFLRGLRNASLKAADTNVVVSGKMLDFFKVEGIDQKKFKMIPNWADGHLIRPLEHRKNFLRKKWGLKDKFVVAYSGNMGPIHEFETVMDAAQILKDDPHILFLFVGQGRQKAWLEHEVEQRQLYNVIFQPYQPEEFLNQNLAAADLHLVTVRPEMERWVSPSKFSGNLAAGRPVIYVGGSESDIISTVAEEKCGYAVFSGEKEKLVALIRNLSKDKRRVRSLGHNARVAFEKHFDKETAMSAWSKLLRN